MALRFGDCALDVDAHELMRSGERVPVEPQVFDVLSYLVANRHRVVPKNELLDEIWGDRFVSESALTSRIKSIRQAVGDSGREQRVIRTIRGRGFRFVADVHAGGDGVGAGASSVIDLAGHDRRPDTGHDLADGQAALGGLADVEATVAGLLGGCRGGALELVSSSPVLLGRLVDEVYESAARAGHLVGRGSGAGSGLRPYGCVLDAVDEVAQRAPDVLDRLPAVCREELDRVLGGEQPLMRPRLFLGVRELLVAAAALGPTLIAVDELQFADPDTFALLDQLARLADHHGVVVVAAHQPGVELGSRFHTIELDDGAPGDGSSDRAALPRELVDVFRLLALEGSSFDLPLFRAVVAAPGGTADQLLDRALAAGVIDAVRDGTGYRFTEPGYADELVADLAPHRRATLHGELAERMIDASADPGRIAHHLVAAHRPADAVPHALVAVRRADADRRYPDVLRWTDAVLDHAEDERAELLARRAAALAGIGDPSAVRVYRDALRVADAASSTEIRTGLARTAAKAGDVETARDALAGLAPDDQDLPPVLHVRAMLAYYEGDLERADSYLDAARGASELEEGTFLDVISLQGLIAHNRGEWFDRLRRELRTTGDSPDLAASIFDSHLCVAEYLLYGPTPYAEVISLAGDLRRNAEERGARRAVAFAACVMGEARLLAGDLDEARGDLVEAVRLHREMGADAGTAHSLQRLAELELACGDREAAVTLLREAVVLARWSPLSHHLLQRAYGTLIAAAPDRETAAALVDEATAVVDGPDKCGICQVMIEVPAAIACAEAGRVDEAREHLVRANASAAYWEGTAWQAACAEAESAIAMAEGVTALAATRLRDAATLFDQAGQPLDAGRCREAASELVDAI